MAYDLSVVKQDDAAWNLQELADQTGVSARTIRFYIARGALDGPSGAGRSASYGPRHVERLREIQQRQAAGETLTEISRGPVALTEAAAPESWWRFSVSSDVVVEIRQNLAPWRMNRIREALEEMVRRLKEDDK